MDIPKGFHVGQDRQQYALKLVRNIYGQKQAGRVWHEYLIHGLTTKLGFQQNQHDPCVLWRGEYVMVIYTDDTIITGPRKEKIDSIMAEIGTVFDITTEPEVNDFLGVKITRDTQDGSFTLTQPHLIKSIIKDLGLQENSNTRTVPALSSRILFRHPDSPDHNEEWNYRRVIGKLNFLEKSSRPDIAYAVHQCARFSQDPKVEHTKAVKMIGRYLMATKDKGVQCKPTDDAMECWADADFAGNWDIQHAEYDPATARSRTGFVVYYGGCPIVWASKLQTEVALSSTESEYVALSQAMREVLPLMCLIEELAEKGFSFNITKPKIICKAFQDNSGAIEMARVPKMRPRTKHMNIKYHHFRNAVSSGKVIIIAVSSEEQVADIFTKPLAEEAFEELRMKLMGW